jgi:NAD(P)-dependent dehydrogenase (short-subunit alcohol dehydrogenase family)
LKGAVQSLFSLKGKAVMVTGGARGIGLAFGLAVAEAVADVAILDILEAPHEQLAKLGLTTARRPKSISLHLLTPLMVLFLSDISFYFYRTGVTKFDVLKARFAGIVRYFSHIDGRFVTRKARSA